MCSPVIHPAARSVITFLVRDAEARTTSNCPSPARARLCSFANSMARGERSRTTGDLFRCIAAGTRIDPWQASPSEQADGRNSWWTPGAGYSPGDFALEGEPSDAARALIGPGPTNRLLESLLDHSDIRVRVAACVALASDDPNASCASRVLSDYLDRFEKGDFTGISRALVMRLRALEGYAEPSVRSRAPYLLYEASAAAGLP